MTIGLLLWGAAPARADIFLSPSVGISSAGFLDGSKITFGGQLGVLTKSWVGVEGDYGFVAKVRGGNGTDNFRTVSGAVLVAPPAIGSAKLRPYVAVGAGLIGAVSKLKHLVDFGDEVENSTVISAGGGVIASLSRHFGIRADARYFRALVKSGSEETTPFFVRATAGLVLQF